MHYQLRIMKFQHLLIKLDLIIYVCTYTVVTSLAD